jgi:hypothetical protein
MRLKRARPLREIADREIHPGTGLDINLHAETAYDMALSTGQSSGSYAAVAPEVVEV